MPLHFSLFSVLLSPSVPFPSSALLFHYLAFNILVFFYAFHSLFLLLSSLILPSFIFPAFSLSDVLTFFWLIPEGCLVRSAVTPPLSPPLASLFTVVILFKYYDEISIFFVHDKHKAYLCLCELILDREYMERNYTDN